MQVTCPVNSRIPPGTDESLLPVFSPRVALLGFSSFSSLLLKTQQKLVSCVCVCVCMCMYLYVYVLCALVFMYVCICVFVLCVEGRKWEIRGNDIFGFCFCCVFGICS